MKKSYLHRAMCVTGSWVRSWGLEAKVQKGYLVVAGRPVRFSRRKGTKGLLVNASRILSEDPDKVHAELQVLAKKLRVKAPPPPRRVEKGHRASADDYLSRSMRLTAFARSANPPEEVLRQHIPTIKREADRAHARYRFLAQKMAFGPHDFLTIGMTFAVTYLHRKADIFSEKRNGANLTNFLQEQFGRWAKATNKDTRNIVPDPQGMEVSDFMGRPVPGAELAHNVVEGYYTIPEYVEHKSDEPEHDENYYLKCREKAKAELAGRLAAMPHDRMVETLFDVATSAYQDFSARELADRLLKQHTRACLDCQAAGR
jgi:hypothetical protein